MGCRTPIVVCVARSVPRLMGAHEIRVRLGLLSRQRVYQITSRKDFPKPVADLHQGKVWRVEDVEAWVAVHRPQDLDEPNLVDGGPLPRDSCRRMPAVTG